MRALGCFPKEKDIVEMADMVEEINFDQFIQFLKRYSRLAMVCLRKIIFFIHWQTERVRLRKQGIHHRVFHVNLPYQPGGENEIY